MNNLGIARDLLGRHAEAQDAYRQALGISPDLVASKVNLALSMAMSGNGARAQQILGPIAMSDGATKKLRHDYAAVLAMSGNQAGAEKILSADLQPAEVREAMAAFASAGTPAPAPDTAQK